MPDFRPVTTDCPENSSGYNRCSSEPSIDSTLNPDWHRNCANMIALADKIHNSPMSLPNLNIFFSKMPVQLVEDHSRVGSRS
jgi:hypothetical protein